MLATSVRMMATDEERSLAGHCFAVAAAVVVVETCTQTFAKAV